MASKKSARSRANGQAATRRTKATRKTTRKKAARGKGASTSAASLRKRAAQAESEVQAETEVQQALGFNLPAMSIGGFQIPEMDLTNMEDTVRGLVDFVEENPLAATAVALGAGVVLTSMYWDQMSDARGKQDSG